ncbi:hypothetical protein [Embleya sp. AB8]|uniref:hypothetical protein n=1 Tax=Embleya sp. AB8 TaxID=3156304 RepID=UPI003C737948
MLIMSAFLETFDVGDFVLWPIAEPTADRRLTLSARLAPSEVSRAMAVLMSYNGRESTDGRDGPATDPAELARRVLAGEDLAAPGGLRVRDTYTGLEVVSGCCTGLENWREWFGLLDGEALWIGHDPWPRVELTGNVVHLWPDVRPDGPPPAEERLEIALADLPALLAGVHENLRGFLASAAEWADTHVPESATELIARIDAGLNISAPGAEDED